MLGIRYIKSQPTTHLMQFRRGRIVRQGPGLSFFYYAPASTLVAVPLASQDAGFILELATSDFQSVTVQGEVTYRVGVPAQAARLMDFSLQANGTYASEDPQRLRERVVTQAKVIIQQAIQALDLKQALKASSTIARAAQQQLGNQAEIQALGLEILGVSIVAVRPTPDIARALEAEAREENLKAADEAIYQRRMAAVQNERSIRQNELDTEVAVEEKRRQIQDAQMEAKAAMARRANELRGEQMAADIQLEEERKNLVASEAENTRALAEAEAFRVRSVMEALEKADPRVVQALAAQGMQPAQLIAQAFGGIADKAERIGQLNVSPELLQTLMGGAPPGAAQPGSGVSTTEQRRVILVTRKTRLEELVMRHNTLAQAKFYVEHLGADFGDYLKENEAYAASLRITVEALERWGRYQLVDRSLLPNFVFAPRDIVVTLGQDGLVANTLKYLDGQPLVGVNPDPKRWDGILLPFAPRQLAEVLLQVAQERRGIREVTMAEARLSDGQVLRAVNDLFIGPRSHTSALYELEYLGKMEFQSSSGMIVSTGLGSTAWMKSVVTGSLAISNALGGRTQMHYEPAAWDCPELTFAVREPFPSRSSQASMVFGRVTAQEPLKLRSRMPEAGVIFSDGLEADFLRFTAGVEAVVGPAGARGHVVW